MASYKKRSQNLMDEISDNLKRTIKKYNEIDNDLSVIQSVEAEETSNQMQENKDKVYEKINLKEINTSAIINNTKKLLNQKNLSYDLNEFNNDDGTYGNLNTNKNYKPNTTNGKANKLLEDLDLLSNDINNDFREVEDMIENVIENELKSFYK